MQNAVATPALPAPTTPPSAARTTASGRGGPPAASWAIPGERLGWAVDAGAAANPGKPSCAFVVKKSATGGQAGVVAATTWRIPGAGHTWSGKAGRYQFVIPKGTYTLTALGKGAVAAGEI